MCAIDFFDEGNKQSTKKELFGLCDDDNKQPAYIDIDISNKEAKWIGIVINADKKEVLFYPVDNCIKLIRPGGLMAQRCEGILRSDSNTLIFTELKDRKVLPAVWLKEAESQIIETLTFFLSNYKSNNYKIKAWISNKQLTNPNYYQQISDFKELTKQLFGNRLGYTLYIDRRIKI